MRHRALGRSGGRFHLERRAVGRIQGEFGPVDNGMQIAIGEPYSFEELRQRVDLDHGTIGVRVETKSASDDDVAEVKWASLRRSHGDDAEWKSLVAAGEVDLRLRFARLGNPKRFGTRAHAGRKVADRRSGRAAAGGGRNIRTHRNPFELGDLSVRQLELEAAQVLLSVG